MGRFIIAILLILGPSVRAQTTSGTITSNETWSGTVTLLGDVAIQNAVVTVMPGTQVKFNTTSNRVINGDNTHISLIVRSGGGLKAIGTEASPILFTTASTSKTGGRWNEIDLEAGIDAFQTAFTYCIFECGNNAIDNRGSNNDPQTQATNPITVENCTIRTMARSGIYITSGGSPTIRHCLFHDLPSAGIFAHGAGNVTVEYTTIYNVSVGIINVGEPTWGWSQHLVVDHVTINHVDGDLNSRSDWWTGYGVYCSGDSRQSADLNLTNTIVADVTYRNNPHTSSGGPIGLNAGNGTVVNDYNCWYQAGYRDIVGADYGDHAVEADPRFTDPAGGDFSLLYDSPCQNAASDGSHIGAWQGTVGIGEPGAESIGRQATAAPNPFSQRICFTVPGNCDRLEIYAPGGSLVRAYNKPRGNSITWDGHELDGKQAAGGIYICRIHTGNNVLQNIILLEK